MSSGWGHTTFPVVPGHEIIGKISALGPNVTQFVLGERVGVGAQVFACLNKNGHSGCTPCASGNDAYCDNMLWTYNSKYKDGSDTYGGYSDYIRVLSDYAFKIPANLPSDLAAPLLCAGATVYTPLKYNIKAGDRVGVVGIGGLGHLALQFIRAMGGIPVAISQSASKEEQARALGAAEFINAVKRAQRSVSTLVLTADASNMPYDMYMSLISAGGKLIMVGLPNDSVKFHPFSLVGPGISFVGSKIGSIQDIKDMLVLAADKHVHPVIRKLPMSQVNKGIQMVKDGSVRYRVVLENEQPKVDP